jgi:hypothetical protein
MKRRTEMKRWLVFPIFLGIALVFLVQTSCMKAPSTKELKESMEIVDMETRWVSKLYQPWPPRLILVPTISFKAKNVMTKPLTYINFNAIFWQKGEKENLGDCYLAVIRGTPVKPGELSPTISMKSNFGVEGKTLDSIKNNPAWKTTYVKLFAQSKGSQFVLLGEWEVSRTIDFKEPEPVGTESKEKKEEKKNP